MSQKLSIMYKVWVTTNHTFAHCRPIYLSDEPLYPLQPEDWVLLKTWKPEGPEEQLVEKRTGPYDVLLTTYSSLKLKGIEPWVHHTQIKQALPEEDSDPAAVVDAKRESWTHTTED